MVTHSGRILREDQSNYETGANYRKVGGAKF